MGGRARRAGRLRARRFSVAADTAKPALARNGRHASSSSAFHHSPARAMRLALSSDSGPLLVVRLGVLVVWPAEVVLWSPVLVLHHDSGAAGVEHDGVVTADALLGAVREPVADGPELAVHCAVGRSGVRNSATTVSKMTRAALRLP